ncbi:MAG: hypothetical protein GPOALKHO_001647 [Sodalis sp.]|nr:MAG: hypothetical protein GPOALKHO_001647 [Sodalis sp.]
MAAPDIFVAGGDRCRDHHRGLDGWLVPAVWDVGPMMAERQASVARAVNRRNPADYWPTTPVWLVSLLEPLLTTNLVDELTDRRSSKRRESCMGAGQSTSAPAIWQNYRLPYDRTKLVYNWDNRAPAFPLHGGARLAVVGDRVKRRDGAYSDGRYWRR